MSTRRRPITSPPGGGSVTAPNRASIGPASRIDARILAQSAGSSGLGRSARVSTRTVFAAGPLGRGAEVQRAPRASFRRRECGGCCRARPTPSASRVAARIGSAAFLLPAGRTVPRSGRPPRTRKRGGMAKAAEGGCTRQAARGGCGGPATPLFSRMRVARRGPPGSSEDEGRMMTLALVQVGATPDWVGPTVAISLVVIAALLAGHGGRRCGYARCGSSGETRKVSTMVQGTRRTSAQALARRAAARPSRDRTCWCSSGRRPGPSPRPAAGSAGSWCGAWTASRPSSPIWRRSYDLVHDEVEDTALDVAAALRSSRRGQRHARPGAPHAGAEPAVTPVRLAGAVVAVGLLFLVVPESGPRLDPGHAHLSRRVGAGEPGAAARRRRRPAPRLPVRFPLRQHRRRLVHREALRAAGPALSLLARGPGDPRSGRVGRDARLRAGLSLATSPPTPSRTTTSSPASSCSPAARRPWATPTGKPGSRPTWATRTRGRPRT